jgi:hypothetical protein
MGMATSRRAGLGFALLALAALSGCDSKANMGAAAGSSSATTSPRSQNIPPDATGEGFAWLRPGPAPAGWRVARIATGAVMPYPPGWRRVAGDKGTATAVLQDAQQAFLGYLNVTPREGDETLRSWARFRVGHNAHEGDRDITTLAAAEGLPFRSGRGTCVRDAYTTANGARFIELACLVAGANAISVIVGAAPPQLWPRMSPVIEQAIAAFTT